MFRKHDLKSGDGIVLEFTGTQSSTLFKPTIS
jgi:hypothetical protein